MIGTTFKLGFDSTSVSRGLGGLTRSLRTGLGRIGVGALERIGHRVTDLMGRIVMAVPEALKETADWAGGMTDMATATGMSVQELILLEEKFRLAGVSAKESGAVVSRFALNLKTARTEGGAAKDALNQLGFYATDFKDLSLDESFQKIGQRVQEMAPHLDNVEGIMADLFGAKIGYQQLKLFKDWAAVSAQAENNVGKLANAMNNGQAANLDRWSDALGRFENFKRSLASMALDEYFRISGGPGSVDRMFNFLDPEKIRPKIQEIMNLLGRNLEVFLNQDIGASFGDLFKNIGRSIGEGIAESISLKNLVPGWLGGNKPPTTTSASSPLPELQKHTALLQQIRDKSVAKFS
jgi:hypothetical protein